MLQINNRLNNTTLSRDELLPRIEIQKTTYEDLWEILRIMNECFKIPSDFDAYVYLYNHKINMLNSVKLVDKETHEIYGLLLLGECSMASETPIRWHNPLLTSILPSLKQLNGIAFILDERLRGCYLDKKMLYYNMEYIKKFDIAWCGVEPSLKTHNYWKRLGFIEVFEDPIAKFYAKFI